MIKTKNTALTSSLTSMFLMIFDIDVTLRTLKVGRNWNIVCRYKYLIKMYTYNWYNSNQINPELKRLYIINCNLFSTYLLISFMIIKSCIKIHKDINDKYDLVYIHYNVKPICMFWFRFKGNFDWQYIASI